MTVHGMDMKCREKAHEMNINAHGMHMKSTCYAQERHIKGTKKGTQKAHEMKAKST
jgi:hypothetical protein